MPKIKKLPTRLRPLLPPPRSRFHIPSYFILKSYHVWIEHKLYDWKISIKWKQCIIPDNSVTGLKFRLKSNSSPLYTSVYRYGYSNANFSWKIPPREHIQDRVIHYPENNLWMPHQSLIWNTPSFWFVYPGIPLTHRPHKLWNLPPKLTYIGEKVVFIPDMTSKEIK